MPLSVSMLVVCAASAALGVMGALIAWRFGGRLGFVDRPNERSSHTLPTPKGGGVGLLLAVLVISIFSDISIGFWLPSTVVALVGLVADRKEIRPPIRLMIQFISAFGLVLSQKYPTSLLQLVLVPFWAVFLVGTANFYNFMDGINGIAGMTGIVGFGLVLLYLVTTPGQEPFFRLAAGLALACCGFLPFNVPRAVVFMGDVGSLLLGFVFAATVFSCAITVKDFVCLASFLFPFYADELWTMAQRIADHDRLFEPHRRHLYQLLVNQERTEHWKVSVGYAVVQACVGGVVMLMSRRSLAEILGLLFVLFIVFGVVFHRIRKRVEMAESP